MKAGMREMTSDEIDAMIAAVGQVVESFRDPRNPSLKLVAKNHGQQSYTCELEGLLVIDDVGSLERRCRRVVPGCKLAYESFANGTVRTMLNLPIHVREDLSNNVGGGGPFITNSGIQRPSTDRAMLLLILLIILLAWLWARL
jgi:hypothetical protein